jgi:hypothetical protein
MKRMKLIVVLRLLRLKLNIQSHLVTLIDDIAMAGRHLPGMETQNAGNGGEVFLCVGDHFIRSVALAGIGPKNHNVGEHLAFYE